MTDNILGPIVELKNDKSTLSVNFNFLSLTVLEIFGGQNHIWKSNIWRPVMTYFIQSTVKIVLPIVYHFSEISKKTLTVFYKNGGEKIIMETKVPYKHNKDFCRKRKTLIIKNKETVEKQEGSS